MCEQLTAESLTISSSTETQGTDINDDTDWCKSQHHKSPWDHTLYVNGLEESGWYGLVKE